MEHAESLTLAPLPSSVPAPRGGTGEAAWKGVAASLLLHLLVGAAAIGAISIAPKGSPPVIDLTLLGPAAEVPAHRAASTLTAAEPAKDPGTVPIPESPAPPVAPAIANRPAEIPPANLPDPAVSSRASATGPAGSLPAAPVVPAFPGVADPSPQSVGTNARVATAQGGGKATKGDPSVKTVAGRPAGDFTGIRDGIQRGIAYPAMARKMGWEGEVEVAFRILLDGTARDIRVAKGSGHAILDRGAVDAVRNASPFPRPPAEAEITTPVVYRLSETP